MRWAVILAGLSGAIGVGMGAAAAHGLSSRLDPDALEWVRTGAEYQLWHSTILAGIGLFGARSKAFRLSAALLALGILVFSGSLYVMAFTGMRWLGAVTPIGGLALIAGWIVLAWAGWRYTGQR